MSGSQQGLGLTFRFDADTKCLMASIVPDVQSVSIDEAWLSTHLTEAGWAALRYVPKARMVLLEKYNQGIPVSDLLLAEGVDASCVITVAPDGLKATLDIVPAQGGKPVHEETVLAALGTNGVTNGVMLDVIREAIVAGEAHGLPIASGRLPVAGDDGWLECLLPEVRNRVPRVDELGHTDYRDLGEIQVVHIGDALMLRHPPTVGVAGLTLLGTSIPAVAGKDIHFAANLTGAEVAADDQNRLVATMNGQPVQVHDGMAVEPVFTVESVNAASGNIRFDGSVAIKGDVLAGMTVHATGDIEVGGVVEAATLDAGGNIVIKGGAMGGLGHHDTHYLRCGGSFSAGYASQARIDAGDSIFIDDSAMQCELTAVNCIRVGNKKSGHIIGGKAHATFSIIAKVIGSPKRVTTHFEIGVNPVIHKQLQEIVKRREAKETQLFELSKVLDFARKNPNKVHPDAVDKARKTAASLAIAIAEIREEQTTLEQKIELSQQSRVVAEQAMHEGVEVSLGGLHYCLVGEHGPGGIGLGKDGLTLLSLAEVAGEPVIK